MTRTWLVRLVTAYAILACILTAAAALRTSFNVHPDESIHGDAICYFQNNLWPPQLNFDGLRYSPDGTSRVYNGEIVYWLWGRVAAISSPVTESLLESLQHNTSSSQISESSQESLLFLPLLLNAYGCTYEIHLYRLLNALLLAVTLAVLLTLGRLHPWPLLLAAVFLCIPQVIYIYSYANSDAWGLSMSLFLFTFAVTWRRPLASLSSTLVLGILTALVILSKQPYWLTIPYSYMWIVIKSRPVPFWHWRHLTTVQWQRNAILLVMIVVVLVLPIKVLYPLSIPDYSTQFEQMREDRAWDGFKPSDLKYPGFRLATKGISFDDIWKNPDWYWFSATSFYGKFGYLTVQLSEIHYRTIGWLTIALIALTYWSGYAYRRILSRDVMLALWTSPLLVGLNVIASLYNSWTFDFQPQGRYLFPSLIPLSLLLGVTLPFEERWAHILRYSVWVSAAALSMWTLYQYVIVNPTLAP